MKHSFENMLGALKCWKRLYSATLSSTSLQSIASHSIGETLSDNVIEVVAQDVREEITKLIVETNKYARRTGASKITMEHLLFAMQESDMSIDLFKMDYNWPVPENGDESLPTSGQTLQNNSKPEDTMLIEPTQSDGDNLTATLNALSGLQHWTKRDQVLLMANKKFPLSKEQQEFYVSVTENCMGTSEPLRREALQRLSAESSLQLMLSKLSYFIAEGVTVNVVQNNFALLIYLLRMVESLLKNPNLKLHQYVHILIPPVISCAVASQVCAFPAVQNHWALREYATRIVADFLRTFDRTEKHVLRRIVDLYKVGLQKNCLTTIYGSLIGLSKIGKFAILSCVIPKILVISELIEPYLTKDKDDSGDDVNHQASMYIKHRLVKMCAPILKDIHNPPDSLKDYGEKYGFLGSFLYDAVVIERLMKDVVEEVVEEQLSTEIEVMKLTANLTIND